MVFVKNIRYNNIIIGEYDTDGDVSLVFYHRASSEDCLSLPPAVQMLLVAESCLLVRGTWSIKSRESQTQVLLPRAHSHA